MNNAPGEGPVAPPPVETPPPGDSLNMSLDLRQVLEKELGLVKVLDYICNDPFDLCFQKNMLTTYDAQLTHPLLGESNTSEALDPGRERLKSLYHNLAIKDRIESLMEKAETLCISRGIKEPVQKRLSKMSLITITGTMVLYFVLLSIEALQAYSTYILFPLMMVFCFLPQYLRTTIMKKWDAFKKEVKPPYFNENQLEIGEVKSFIQEVMNDARERMLTNRIPLQAVRFILFSKDYANIQVIETQNLRGTLNYIMQFQYEPGMEPFPMPGQPSELVDVQTTIAPPKKDEKDLFIILKSAKFDDDGALVNYDLTFPPQELHSQIDLLLSQSDFQPVENPREIIFNFNSNNSIFCDCGDSVKFINMKYCTSKDPKYENFEFYLAIGETGSCGKTPYVLFASPGVAKIPQILKDLF